ncbi:hypothetical protein [Marinicella rhabdoformis]|uniref:hypothetical protein n=1 Tax=Marinicella rhabdoformis TaxID=2580566 RepID=UPI0012AED516|nr:hypothetical protein [Marinicella rhabdoformis]
MKVAAGVILIIAALFNLFAGLAYLGGGAATSGLSGAVNSEYVQQNEMTSEQRAELDRVTKEVGSSGMGFMAFGVYLLVSVGILIAGAVFLFTNKKPQFIMIAGGMAILGEVIGILITAFGITNIVGIVGGVLAIICAKSMGGGAEQPIETAE